MMQAANIVAEPLAVGLPDQRLQPIRTDLLRSLMLADSARNTHESAQANATFLRALAQAHVLAYRASFHVTVNHRGEKSVDVCFSYDAELECF